MDIRAVIDSYSVIISSLAYATEPEVGVWCMSGQANLC